MVHANTPVLVGVGQLLNRIESLEQAIEPIEMMLDACGRAERDTGVGADSSPRCGPFASSRACGTTRTPPP